MIKIIKRDGTVFDTYETEMDLLIQIKRMFDGRLRLGVEDLVKYNSLLSRCCHNWNDANARYHWFFDPDLRHSVFRREESYYEYMILDEYDRVMNIRDLAYEAWDVELPPEKSFRWRYELEDGSEWWEEIPFWNLHYKRCKNAAWMNNKGIRVQQERRQSCDEMHKPFIKGSRTKMMLDPWGWGGKRTKAQITWKQLKIKKQWMEKL